MQCNIMQFIVSMSVVQLIGAIKSQPNIMLYELRSVLLNIEYYVFFFIVTNDEKLSKVSLKAGTATKSAQQTLENKIH